MEDSMDDTVDELVYESVSEMAEVKVSLPLVARYLHRKNMQNISPAGNWGNLI